VCRLELPAEEVRQPPPADGMGQAAGPGLTVQIAPGILLRMGGPSGMPGLFVRPSAPRRICVVHDWRFSRRSALSALAACHASVCTALLLLSGTACAHVLLAGRPLLHAAVSALILAPSAGVPE